MFVIKDTLANRVFPAEKCSWELHKNENGSNYVKNAAFYGIEPPAVSIKQPILGRVVSFGNFEPMTVAEE